MDYELRSRLEDVYLDEMRYADALRVVREALSSSPSDMSEAVESTLILLERMIISNAARMDEQIPELFRACPITAGEGVSIEAH